MKKEATDAYIAIRYIAQVKKTGKEISLLLFFFRYAGNNQTHKLQAYEFDYLERMDNLPEYMSLIYVNNT